MGRGASYGIQYLSVIDEKAQLLEDTANYLWDNPETAFTEYKAAEYLCNILRQEGFTVRENLASIPTAFSGSYGSGKPVIGILGEFDALNGMSQEAGALEKKSIGQAAGHGCGHNLFAADPKDPIAWKLMPYTEAEPASGSSTDVGDVSWVCSTAQIQTATVARGTDPHSWQWVAQSKDPLAHKMTRYGAKVMAAGVVELMTNADLLSQAQEEFSRRVDPTVMSLPFPRA